MVTPEPPVNAVKNPHNNRITTGVPPGNQPNSTLNTLTKRSDASLSAKIYPARVNNGIVARWGETTIR